MMRSSPFLSLCPALPLERSSLSTLNTDRTDKFFNSLSLDTDRSLSLPPPPLSALLDTDRSLPPWWLCQTETTCDQQLDRSWRSLANHTCTLPAAETKSRPLPNKPRLCTCRDRNKHYRYTLLITRSGWKCSPQKPFAPITCGTMTVRSFILRVLTVTRPHSGPSDQPSTTGHFSALLWSSWGPLLINNARGHRP